MLEASKECEKLSSKHPMKPRKVYSGSGGKKKKDDLTVDSFDFTKKAVHTAWHPEQNIIALTEVNNLYLFNGRD
jgi:serine/threonine-protein phosphatase 2A regulatory subunit B